MSRRYKNVRPRKHFVYTVEGVMKLCNVSRNTVSHWVNEGLRPSDDLHPYVFGGAAVKQFLDRRRSKTKASLRTGEFKCFSCKGRVFPEPGSLERKSAQGGKFTVVGQCPDCQSRVVKLFNETDWDKLWKCTIPNTSPASQDEGLDQTPVHIGKDTASATDSICARNDRILHDWLQYAGCWSEKTISAKLAAIRQFETFCDGKAFSKITKKDVARFREHLKASVESPEEKRKSISTVRHQASHVKTFLAWLIGEKGFRGLDRTLPIYLELPKRFDAAVLAGEGKPCPTLDEAVQMVAAMPSQTIKQRRDRAMVAIAFLAALRADTITSLLIGHLDAHNRVVVQDARRSRTKNGKSLRIHFFPVPSVFAETVTTWSEELLGLGYQHGDAPFPEERCLLENARPPASVAVSAMSSSHAVATAFKTASAGIGRCFTPHSAKHLIGQLSFKMCKSPEEQKVWSMNMGHESEDVTLRYYKKIPAERVYEIFEAFGEEPDETIDDKELMLLYHDHALDRGTPQFERARKLVRQRQNRDNGR